MAKRGFIKYSTYHFNEQDPVVGILWSIKREKGIKDSAIVAESKVSTSTIGNWWKKKTKRPQFATVAAVAVVLGLDSLPLTPEGRKKLRG